MVAVDAVVAGWIAVTAGRVVTVVAVCVRVTVFVEVVVGAVEPPPPPRPARTSSTTMVAASRKAAGAAYRESFRLPRAGIRYQPETAQTSPASLAASAPAAARQSPPAALYA